MDGATARASHPRRVAFVILGEPASKANNRRLLLIDGKPRFVKSSKALAFACSAALQIPVAARVMFEGPVRVTLRMFYSTERPDLDESIVLDVLQALTWQGKVTRPGVYRNDRQVREKHVFHDIDRVNPRVEVEVEPRE